MANKVVESLTVRELQVMLSEAEKRYEQRFMAQERAVAAAMSASREAIDKAERAIQRDAEKTERQTQRDVEKANEWRGAMNDRERTLMSRNEAEQANRALNDRISSLIRSFDERFQALDKQIDSVERSFNVTVVGIEKRLGAIEGKGAGLASGWTILIASIGLVGTLIFIFMFLTKQ